MRWLASIGLAAALAAGGAAAAPATAPREIAARVQAPASKVTTPAQRCAALEKQFDDALRARADGHGLASAKKLRTEGGHLCDIGRHASGALRLSHALEEIGLEAEEP